MALSEYTKGMVLVTGPAGSGKSTTLACLVDRINTTKQDHIITLEDPLEYLHRHKESIVSQREIPPIRKIIWWLLRAALRQSPDVILLGEMRDFRDNPDRHDRGGNRPSGAVESAYHRRGKHYQPYH